MATEASNEQEQAGASRLVAERFEQSHIGEILRPASRALHLQQIVAMSDRDRHAAERDLVCASTAANEPR